MQREELASVSAALRAALALRARAGVRWVYSAQELPSAPAAVATPMSDRTPVFEVPSRLSVAGALPIVGESLEDIRADLGDSTRCKLHKERTQIVFGAGSPRARLMFIGEGPGREEDLQGKPFVGPAGQLLTKIIQAIGLEREDVYIANVVKCLRYNALVQLGDGSWERIGRLVRKRYDGDVMSVESDGTLNPRRITGWHETLLGPRRVFKLTYRSAKKAGAGRVSIQLTGDHPVLTERGYVRTDDLLPTDRIATGQGVSHVVWDLLCGTLLGDGHLDSRQGLLSLAHSKKQEEYALFKAELLRELRPHVSELSVAAGGDVVYPTIHVRTRANRALHVLRREFYRGKKIVPAWIADKLNVRMLAFWFLDDGHMRLRPGRRPGADISTDAFSAADVEILVRGLARLGLMAWHTRGGHVQFDVGSTRLLAEMIAPFVPPGMRYKLPTDVAESIPFDRSLFADGPRRVMFDDVEVQEIEHLGTDKRFFCIDVAGTHNFVTAGGVVHNCRPPNNRNPEPEEIAACLPFLERQIAAIQPAVIVGLGNVPVKTLLGTTRGITSLRGQWQTYRGIPFMPTFHPSYLLRQEDDDRTAKRQVWDDMQEVAVRYNQDLPPGAKPAKAKTSK